MTVIRDFIPIDGFGIIPQPVRDMSTFLTHVSYRLLIF